MPEIDRWLRRMVELKGSDLHLRAASPPMWRVHGHLAPIPEEPVLEHEKLGHLMREILNDDLWKRYEKALDFDFAYAMGEEARFRVNYFKQLRGYGCVLRHIPAKVLTLADLGAPEVLKNLPHYRNGLVLVTGPTGSGKSTTLAAIIDEINQHYSKHVITIEDPIEFVHKNINCIVTQREVGNDTPEFARALKDALREDPDVILVGEMRDLETIALAITLAETGVLIFGTLHTNSAAKTIDRIIDVFPAEQQQQVRTMLSTSLRAIVAQQLLKRADKPGRIAAHEILISSPALGNMIREGRTEKISSYIQSGRNQGMITMDTTLRNYLNQGWINGEEAYMFALDKQQFEKYFRNTDEEEGGPKSALLKGGPKSTVVSATKSTVGTGGPKSTLGTTTAATPNKHGSKEHAALPPSPPGAARH
jgi:twitching motility protein PilT